MFSLSDYRFFLPKELIAETAASPAHNAKLMIINQKTGNIDAETTFWNIDDFLDEKSVLFFNNSRVLRARIPLHQIDFCTQAGHKGSIDGEIFFLKNIDSSRFEALVRPWKKFKIGTTIFLKNYEITVESNTQTGRILSVKNGNIDEIMEQFGELPLPPYIEYSPEKEKDYQNIFAQKNGSVAAPTASLHFTEELFEKIWNEKYFVTLHVGLGTFRTIDTDDIRNYTIHKERAEVEINIFEKIFSLKKANKNIIAVGTTSCRTLESLASLWKNLDEKTQQNFSHEVQDFWNKKSQNADKKWISEIIKKQNSLEFSTRAYITPGYTFGVIDELITNFHLPESSLLVLVSALIGTENLMKNYEHAIKNNYRFFSFGDGMYLKK